MKIGFYTHCPNSVFRENRLIIDLNAAVVLFKKIYIKH